MKTFKNFIAILLVALTICSCSSDDDNNTQQFYLTIDTTEYEAMFYTNGETEAVNLILNGSEPLLALAEGTDESISFNPITLKIEWTKLLPLGDNNVTLIATGTNGEQDQVTVTITNKFQGTFSGGYNFNSNSSIITSTDFMMVLNSDGSLTINDEGNEGSGSWSINDNVITLTLTYDIATDTYYTFLSTVFYDSAEAFISGLWYDGEIVDNSNLRGYFYLDFQ